jgi:hypothetical protein
VAAWAEVERKEVEKVVVERTAVQAAVRAAMKAGVATAVAGPVRAANGVVPKAAASRGAAMAMVVKVGVVRVAAMLSRPQRGAGPSRHETCSQRSQWLEEPRHQRQIRLQLGCGQRFRSL